MKITRIKRTKKRIIIDWIHDGEERSIRAPDNPLPAFNDAFNALAPLVCQICHLAPKYAHKLTVLEVKLTDKGNELVTFKAAKDLDDSSDTFNFTTPNRLTDQPKEEGKTSPPLKADQVALIASLIDEAAAYVKGDRAQGMIQFPAGADDDEDGEDGEGSTEPEASTDPLPFPTAADDTGQAVKPKAPRKPRAPKAAAGE